MWFLTCFFSPMLWSTVGFFEKQHGIDVVVSITKMMTVKFGIENITTFCFVLRSKALLSKDMGEVFDLSKSCLDFGTLEVQQLEPPIDSKKTPIHSTVQTHPGHSIRAEHHSSTPDLKPSNQLAEALFAFIWSGSVRLTQSRCCHLQTWRIDRIRINEFRCLCLFIFVQLLVFVW